jgi:hypothetical protein
MPSGALILPYNESIGRGATLTQEQYDRIRGETRILVKITHKAIKSLCKPVQ